MTFHESCVKNWYCKYHLNTGQFSTLQILTEYAFATPPNKQHLLLLIQRLRIIHSRPRNLLQQRLKIRLAELLPPIQALARINRERLIPLLNHNADLLRTKVLPFLAIRQQRVIVRRHADQDLHCACAAQTKSVAEFGQDVTRLDELVEKVVVGCGVGEEVLAAGEGECKDVDEDVDHFVGFVVRFDVGFVLG